MGRIAGWGELLTTAALAARLVRPRPRVVAHRRVDVHLRRHPLSRWKYARGPDRLIAVSEAVREMLVEDGVPAARVKVVHDGIRLDLPPSEATPDLRERVGAGPAEPHRVGKVEATPPAMMGGGTAPSVRADGERP